MTERIDVLHVDDDPSVLDLAEAYFDRELESVSVTSVTDPESALDRLAESTFDCLVSDYDMPAMDGLEFFETLRADHPHVPFVLYTGKGSEEIASRALNAGVTGYFQKGGSEQLQRLANRVKQAAEEYRTQRAAERYSTVLTALGYPIYVVDETGTFEYVNEAFAELTGYDREEAVGVNCRFLQGPDTDQEAVDELRDAIESQEPASVELLNYRKDGTPFWNRVSVAPIREDDDGPVTGWVGFQEDITEFKEREAALRRQNERLDEFAGIVSHDLRNPLNVAQGRVDLASEETGNEHLDAARNALDRMETIVEHTLTLAREGQSVGETEPVSVAEVAAESWEAVDTGDAVLDIDADRSVSADPTRLRNLFENLMRNSIEHGSTKGVFETAAGSVDGSTADADSATGVTVRVGDLEDGFYVADDGPGIPEEMRDGLFEPGESGRAGNTGFGLTIVKEIANAHGWTVESTDSEAGGARFEIRGVERPSLPIDD